jgi:hypothetical protein
MSLSIIAVLILGLILCAYALYLETTKCKLCSMKYNNHKTSCPKNEKYMGQFKLNGKRNHESWVTCKECLMCFDARHHGYDCPYCHTNNR